MKAKDLFFAELRKEHRALESLLNEPAPTDPRNRRLWIKMIEQSLIPHARAEEIIYTRVKKRARNRGNREAFEVTELILREHHHLDFLVSQLKEACLHSDCRGNEWDVAFEALQEQLRQHIKDEENDLFPELHHLFSPEERDILLEDFLDAKAEYEDSLPTFDQTEKWVKITVPFFGLF